MALPSVNALDPSLSKMPCRFVRVRVAQLSEGVAVETLDAHFVVEAVLTNAVVTVFVLA